MEPNVIQFCVLPSQADDNMIPQKESETQFGNIMRDIGFGNAHICEIKAFDILLSILTGLTDNPVEKYPNIIPVVVSNISQNQSSNIMSRVLFYLKLATTSNLFSLSASITW